MIVDLLTFLLDLSVLHSLNFYVKSLNCRWLKTYSNLYFKHRGQQTILKPSLRSYLVPGLPAPDSAHFNHLIFTNLLIFTISPEDLASSGK